jgi:hypothetical protein
MLHTPRPRHTLKLLAPTVAALALFIAQAGPALACGGLVAPDGDVRLARANTFVAWHDGIEHYMTAFAYTDPCAAQAFGGGTPPTGGAQPGGASAPGVVSPANATPAAAPCTISNSIGWIVPLPAVPISIQPGGRWTFQRLFNETHPIVFDRALAAGAAAPSAANVQVIQTTQIEALDITVLRGTGEGVVDWCRQNGFVLNGDTRDHLLIYAKGSPIFMAAKYDAARALARHQIEGDGAAILITMRTPRLWVPLEVLALDGQQVQADLYLVTDMPVNTSEANAILGESGVGHQIPNAPGFTLAFQERMTPDLYHDLSSDRNMRWLWPSSWVTYLALDAPNTTVTYDLGLAPDGVIRLAPFGTPPMRVGDVSSAVPVPHLPLGTPEVVLAVLVFLAIAGGLVVTLVVIARRDSRVSAAM